MSNIVIFGATSSIAEHVARRYAEAGARLFLVARDKEKLKLVAADLRARGASAVSEHVFDFTALREVPKLVAALPDLFGMPDRALIAYGTLPDQATTAASIPATHDALDINFTSPALLLQALAALMEKTGGAIAVIGSVAGDRGRASNYIYGAAKGGLGIFAQGLAHRLAGTPLSIVLVKPGFVDTPMTSAIPNKGTLWAQPETVAAQIHNALERRQSAIVYTPWFWRFILLIIRLLPQPIMHKTRF